MKDLKIDESTGLVLEGGGMRGVFTCGVLDYFMDHDILNGLVPAIRRRDELTGFLPACIIRKD